MVLPKLFIRGPSHMNELVVCIRYDRVRQAVYLDSARGVDQLLEDSLPGIVEGEQGHRVISVGFRIIPKNPNRCDTARVEGRTERHRSGGDCPPGPDQALKSTA